MCGRFIIMSDQDIEEIKDIAREIDRKYGEGSMPSGEIFPTNKAPVFVASENGYGAELMTWGLPQYKGSGVIINARAETVQEKRTFQDALQLRRCLIPSTGFFEWTHDTAKKKEKYLFNQPDSPMLYMAGLYNLIPGEEMPRYVILTTTANDSMQEIHDRMPVILSKEEIGEWITQSGFANEALLRVPQELLRKRVG
jgi:putative SOS response-associated peptidase YedK